MLLCEFDSRAVHAPNDPAVDTQTTLFFPRPFVARPRLPNGFRELDIDKNSDIRAKATLFYFSRDWADTHITAWGGTTLYTAIDDVLALAPADLAFLSGAHMRNLLVEPNDPSSVRINFVRPFLTPPKVVVFFNYIDLDKNRNWRLKTFATDIDAKGFTINIETWADTVLNAAQVVWIAYPEDRQHIFSTSVNTQELRPSTQPQLQHSKQITFGDVEFWKDPTVFIAFNSFDIGCTANFRLRAYVDGVSRNNLVWHLDSWADTVLYSAGASIIAFNN